MWCGVGCFALPRRWGVPRPGEKTFGIIFLWDEIERMMLTDLADRLDYGIGSEKTITDETPHTPQSPSDAV